MRRWTFNPLVALHWQHFDGDWVIFDEGSGQTLAVDAVIAAALMSMQAGCSTELEITRQILSDMPLVDATGLADQLAIGLEFMAQLGLIEEMSE